MILLKRVFRKDEHGNEVEAVLLGRNGDIGIASANVVAEIMANVPIDEEPAEKVTGEVEASDNMPTTADEDR